MTRTAQGSRLPAPGVAVHSVAVVSDTHGLLRPAVLDRLVGVERIIHAGDVGGPDVLVALEAVAPVLAVRGNVDTDPWGKGLPAAARVEIGGILIHVLHDLAELAGDPRAAGVRIVVSGHSHQPHLREREGVLYLNPGSIGPRRFHLPVSFARLEIRAGEVRVQFETFEGSEA